MKKRFTKFLALLLSTTMVFTLNTTVFGKTGAGEEIEAEVEEGGTPDVLKIDTNNDDSQYKAGVDQGINDANTDTVNGNRDQYWPEHEDRTDPGDGNKKFSEKTIAYQTGYYDGYAATGHSKYLVALKNGFNMGYNLYTSNYDDKDAISNYKDTNPNYGKPDGNDSKEYIDTWQAGFESGVKVGMEAMSTDAYDTGYAAIGNEFKDYATWDKYLASAAYEALETFYKDYVDGYFKRFMEGMKAAYEYNAKTQGYADGRTEGDYDGTNPPYTRVSDFSKEEDAQAYADAVPATINPGDDNRYMAQWKTYHDGWAKDPDGNAETHGTDIVGSIYIENYKLGYDKAYAISVKDTNLDIPKIAYCDGFDRGYAVGLVDNRNNNEEAKTEDKEKDANNLDPTLLGTTYHGYTEDKYSETNPNGHTDKEIAQYKDGFEFGYEAAKTNAAYDEGYNKGYDSGAADAGRDQYNDNLNPNYQGYWEHDYPNSPYKLLKGSNTPYAKGYIAGYDDGYNAGINAEKTRQEVIDFNAKGFDYSAAEMDPWRASTDPAEWDTAQLLVNENAPGALVNGYYQDQYFDTRAFRNNPTPVGGSPFRNMNGALQGRGGIVATSPFQYYFDLYDKDHLVDRKTVSSNLKLNDYNVYVNGIGENNGSIGQYVYAAFSASSNKAKKAKKGAVDTGTPYIIVRYWIAGSETDENYKVRRYAFDTNGGESVVFDHINNYYQGTDKNGSIVNEPVVPYDSRKIAGVKRNKDGELENNDKSNRYIIDAEALLITWTEGQPAQLIGGVELNIKAKDNVNATVPRAYLDYLGDTVLLQQDMANPHGYTNDGPVELRETDRPVAPAGNETFNTNYNGFSKYYEVKKVNSDLGNGKKAEMGVVTFKGAQSVPKLAAPAKGVTDFSNSNAYMSKKGSSPTFTLKAGKLDPSLKAYSKDIKMALKNAELHFEISRMKISSDYVQTIDTIGGLYPVAPIVAGYNAQRHDYIYEDSVLAAKLNSLFPVAPKRSECGSLDEYQKKVKEYNEKNQKYRDYLVSQEWVDLYRTEFKKAVEALRAEYQTMLTKYGSKLDYMQKWIEEDWAVNTDNTLWNGNAVEFPYTVTKADRTSAGQVVPIGRNEKYRGQVPEDADCDGIITAVEHYEYEVQVGNWPDNVDDPRFNGKLEAGDNIELTAAQRRLIEGDVVFDTVGAGVTPGQKAIADITFNYDYYDVDGVLDDNAGGHYQDLTIQDNNDGRYIYDDGQVIPAFSFSVFVDFLEDQETDIGLIEGDKDNPGHEPCVLWPGAEELTTAAGGARIDTVDIDFSDAVIKAGKKTASGNSATMTVKATLHSSVANGWIIPRLLPNFTESEKNLKVFIPKADKNGVVTIKKLPKADLQMEQKMAEIEPFVVVTGINNYEGSIAIRQRKNGDLGYGYYKNDDFYYIFSEDE